MAREQTKPKARGVSLDDDDAIDVGLFASGPARIAESIFTTYDYQGTSRRPPLVWLITFERGEGKERETYEQPYTIGKGWDVSKDGKTLVPKNGQIGLPKTCNAILYLIKPLKKALKAAKLSMDLASGDPSILEGMEVVLERIDQEERDIKDRDRDGKGRGDRDRDERGGRGGNDDRGPRTILVIDEVVELPGEGKPSSKKKGRDDDEEEEEEEEQPKKKGKSKSDDDDEEEEDTPKRGAKAKGKSKSDDDDEDEPEEGDQDEDEAVEAVIAVVEKGPIKLTALEEALVKVLKKHKRADAIIDLATSKVFLKKERGWTFDGKMLDAEDTK